MPSCGLEKASSKPLLSKLSLLEVNQLMMRTLGICYIPSEQPAKAPAVEDLMPQNGAFTKRKKFCEVVAMDVVEESTTEKGWKKLAERLGLERVNLDCSNLLNNALEAYLKYVSNQVRLIGVGGLDYSRLQGGFRVGNGVTNSVFYLCAVAEFGINNYSFCERNWEQSYQTDKALLSLFAQK
ncbi:hypothetical protein ZIOFF_075681 [Zingiber officinale]|uniref:Uncharacterized protein n=1 Tax=Zingiber officinale TaxID=94328 RepID=A0A8J5C476_ZINOF|nr:hypothetical protein ZIOFF_075681 [Zingiber officinale]